MNWFVLMTAPQREFVVAHALGDIGCGVYLPTRWVERARRGREKRSETVRIGLALFPGYVFAQAAEGHLYSTLERSERDAWARGSPSYIRGVVSVEGHPIIVPQTAIDAVVRIENDLRFIPAPAPVLILAIGDRVTVTLGPNDKAPGIVIGKPDSKGKVKVDTIEGQRKVSVSSVRLAA